MQLCLREFKLGNYVHAVYYTQSSKGISISLHCVLTADCPIARHRRLSCKWLPERENLRRLEPGNFQWKFSELSASPYHIILLLIFQFSLHSFRIIGTITSESCDKKSEFLYSKNWPLLLTGFHSLLHHLVCSSCHI